MEMKVNERLAAVRNEARAELGALDNATKIGTETYIMAVANGYAKVTISAVKDADFDVDVARAEYEEALADRAAKAEAKAVAKAEKEAEREAKKAAKAKAE